MTNDSSESVELRLEEKRLAELERQYEKQYQEITKFEEIRNRSDLIDASRYNDKIMSLNQHLETIKDNILVSEKKVESIKAKTHKSLETQEEEKFSDFSNGEAIDEFSNESEINELESTINLGEYGNANSNPYWSEFQQEEKDKENQGDTKRSQLKDISQNVSAVELIRSQDSIKKTILYLVTFFPRLSRNDFKRTLAFLLKDQLTNIEIPVESEVESSQKTITVTKSLYEVWQVDNTNNFDVFMEECYLTWLPNENSIRGLDFELPYLRNDLKAYFENRGFDYSNARFERARLLLLDASNEVVKNAVDLSIEMAINSDHLIYGERWLSNLLDLFSLFNDLPKFREVFGLESFAIIKILFPEDKEKQEEFTSFIRFVSEIKEEFRGEFVISRIAILIQRMLDYPILKPGIDSFLQQQIDKQNQEALLAIVALLQSVPKFDWLFWIRKLLNEKSGVISTYTRQIFFSKLRESRNDIYELLKEIKSWLPKEQLRRKDYDQADVFALRLIYKYSQYIASELELSDFGCYPPRYQLFADLDHGLADENLKLLIEWVFHPGHRNFVTQPMREASLLIAEWFSILCGFDSEAYNPENLALANRLLTQVTEATTLEQQNELVQQWSRHVQYLGGKSSKAYASSQGTRQEELIQKRYSIIDLIEQFENLRVNEF